MPQIKTKNIKKDHLKLICKDMIDELQGLIECPRNYFTIECLNSEFITDGEIPAEYPFVEVSWFDRGQETKDKTAKIITKYIQKVGYDSVDIIFNSLNTKDYYENGEHF
ncbi:DUF1904 domain-containing protein [Haloimpatiens lingqiaonensis]|uniref:DUF1904 domain-containing protein n=1 Tax=Haloimpatiens lingqiaonensis TaxID=1380675 RepID=UPI0010FD3D83|nr:DUF1904 domain-containing protein [Haloimpatiens lingqiaonensis]